MVSQARDARGFPGEHEEIKISATIHERRFVLLADLCDQRHRTMVLPGNLCDYVKIFHDLLDRECGVVDAVHDRVALVLQQRRGHSALADHVHHLGVAEPPFCGP